MTQLTDHEMSGHMIATSGPLNPENVDGREEII